MKTALICGVSGQDGAYLAQFLLAKGYRVVGSSRDAAASSFSNLARLGIKDRVELTSCALNDFRSVAQALLRFQPDEIYNLSGQSSVGLSFEQPVETLESIATGTLNVMEAVRMLGREARIYNACSSEVFGDTHGNPADEQTPFHPRSPYGVAKATAFWATVNYREAYGLHACSGILFNHDSPLRPPRFVTRKVVQGACRISKNKTRGERVERLHLGNLSVWRDWGWAPEYVEAMWLMLQGKTPEDFIVATGESRSLEDFVAKVFATVGLDYKDHVDSDPSLLRPSDIAESRANPDKVQRELGWRAKFKMADVAAAMVKAELEADGHDRD